jgi:hypothetical protein
LCQGIEHYLVIIEGKGQEQAIRSSIVTEARESQLLLNLIKAINAG